VCWSTGDATKQDIAAHHSTARHSKHAAVARAPTHLRPSILLTQPAYACTALSSRSFSRSRPTTILYVGSRQGCEDGRCVVRHGGRANPTRIGRFPWCMRSKQRRKPVARIVAGWVRSTPSNVVAGHVDWNEKNERAKNNFALFHSTVWPALTQLSRKSRPIWPPSATLKSAVDRPTAALRGSRP
jgi:hypothetical protein